MHCIEDFSAIPIPIGTSRRGKWILTERAVPRHDIFSYTAVGRPWVNIEWLVQIILFSIYDWFGWRGLVLLCALAIALTFVLCMRRLPVNCAPSAKRPRVAIEWLSFLIGALLAACVTPYGYQSLLLTLEFFSLGDLLHSMGDGRPMNPVIGDAMIYSITSFGE